MYVFLSIVFRIQDDDSFWGVDQKTSTRFDHNFSITDFLKINLGTQVALRLVSSVAHALVLLFWFEAWESRPAIYCVPICTC